MIYCMRRKRKQVNMQKKKELLSLNDMTLWKDFRLSYISEVVWVEYIYDMTFTCFT